MSARVRSAAFFWGSSTLPRKTTASSTPSVAASSRRPREIFAAVPRRDRRGRDVWRATPAKRARRRRRPCAVRAAQGSTMTGPRPAIRLSISASAGAFASGSGGIGGLRTRILVGPVGDEIRGQFRRIVRTRDNRSRSREGALVSVGFCPAKPASGNSVPWARTAIGAPVCGIASTLFQESAKIPDMSFAFMRCAIARCFIYRRRGLIDPNRWMA